MASLHNILMSQNSSRPPSPAAAALKSSSGGPSDAGRRSFEDTLSEQSDVNGKKQTTASDRLDDNRSASLRQNDSENAEPTRTGRETETNNSDLGTQQTASNDSRNTRGDIYMASEPDVLQSVATEQTPDLTVVQADVDLPPTDINLALAADAAVGGRAGLLTFGVGGDPSNPTHPITKFPPNAQALAVDAGTATLTAAAIPAAQTALDPDADVKTPAVDATLTAEVDGDAVDTPRHADRAAETAELRAQTKFPATAPDAVKLTDGSATATALTSTSDTTAPLKSLPIVTTLPTLTPISGMSDRLAATILQTANAQPTVTLDKLPQTVVAIALSAKSATLRIDPPELGRIQLDYQFDSQGRTVVTLTPESDAARLALVDRIATITAALEQGSNGPIEVHLADARDFGSEFGQAAQDGDAKEGDQSGQNGPMGTHADSVKTDDLQRFMRAPSGEAERLHILV